MRHVLPPRPHLQHLRKQAKELLDAYREGDRDAQQRFLENLPALSGLGQAELAQMKLALHDAQSVIAREYGFDSWRQLRRELEQRDAWRVAAAMIAEHIKRPLPPEVLAALHASWSGQRDTQRLADLPLPASLPVLAVRDFVLTPGSIAPLHVMRPVSLAALDAAAAALPVTLATFTQREAGVEVVERENLYPVGCQLLVRGRFDQAQGTIIIVEGVRWITLQQLESAGNCLRASVTAARSVADDNAESEQLIAASEAVRERARRLAKVALPESGPAIELIDSLQAPDQLADLVIGNMQCPVADKARYAAQPDACERMRIVASLLDAQLATLASR